MIKLRFILCMTIAFLVSNVMYSQSYKVAIGDIPGIEPLIQMIKIMGTEMRVNIEINKVPMQRMVNMMITKQADIGMPMLAIKNQDQINNLPYDYSTDEIGGGVTFVLYSNKSKPIDIESLKKGNPQKYNIESDRSNINLFSFTTLPSDNVEVSFRKVESGRIDGYIMG